MRTNFRRTIMACGLVLLMAGAAHAANEVVVKSAGGEVAYSSAKGPWKPLKPDTRLSAGDVVRTGKDGSAVLVWFDGHKAKLTPLTEFAILEVANKPGEPESTQLGLEKGRALLWVKKLSPGSSRFTVRTPAALCGVRGTFFSVAHDENAKSTIQVVEGMVEVIAEGETRLLGPDSWTEVELGQAPQEPMPLNEEDLRLLEGEMTQAAGAGPETMEPDAAAAAAEFLTDDVIEQTTENVLIDDLMTPAGDCCDY